MPSAEDVAQACLKTYASLPRRGKPLVRSNGQPEWTVLAGFLLANDVDGSTTVISLGYVAQADSALEADCHTIAGLVSNVCLRIASRCTAMSSTTRTPRSSQDEASSFGCTTRLHCSGLARAFSSRRAEINLICSI